MRRIFRNLIAGSTSARTRTVTRSNPRRTRLSVLHMEDRVVPALIPVTSNLDSGAGTFRDAVTLANGNGTDDVIEFQFGAPGATITLLSQVLITEDTGAPGKTIEIRRKAGDTGTVTFD